MDFSAPPRRARAESIVPMINVVFLLLIFFLMTSHLAPPDPFEVTPPTAESQTEPEVDRILYVGPSGRMSFERHEGDAALSALAASSDSDSTIKIRLDAELEAATLAELLQNLASAGLSHAELIVTAQ